MLDEIESKNMHKDKKAVWYQKKKWDTEWSKASWKHKQELQSFLEISSAQKEVLPSHKLQEHEYEY